jgi:subtilisin family serine protease
MRRQIIIMFICLASNVNSFAQTASLLVKIPTVESRDVLLREGNKIYVKNKPYQLVQSYPKAKNPELLLYYDIVLESEDVHEIVSELKAMRNFESIDVYEIAYTTSTCASPVPTNDEKIVNGTYNCYHLELINARCAWSITKGNPNVKIAIADTDFELTHEDLENQIVQISGNISGGHAHGIRVSGSAAAEANNGKGIAGIGYNSKIAAYRVVHSIASNGGATAPSSNIKDAIWSAYLDGHRIINVSWTGTGLTSLAAQEITNNGAVLTLGAGNDSVSVYHSTIANIPGVIAVSSVDRNNNYYVGHARSQYIDLCAPGVGIATTWQGNGYGLATGTSHAAPIVAGTVALMLSINPNLTPAEIETILKNTAAPINNAHLYQGLIGAGRLDAYAAVQAACATAPSTVNFTNEIVTSNTTVNSCGNINVQYVKVQNGAKLTLDAAGEVNIISDFEVDLGSEFEIIYP